MCIWLDTETKALLQQLPPEKYAPPDTGTFTLVFLEKGSNDARVIRSLTRIPGVSEPRAALLASRPTPTPIANRLSLADALLGQFELVCSDSISIFLRDEIASSAAGEYLTELYLRFRWSSEFENVRVIVAAIPSNDSGERLVDQFLGGADIIFRSSRACSYMGRMLRKKARILSHWAKKIGVEVTIMGEESGI